MARRVFFSFHYARDVRRVVQVRNSWVVRPGGEAQPFYDKAEFENAKRRAGGIQQWIDDQLKGTSVTVVLFGTETAQRKWVRYEIERSYALRKGIVAIDIHRVNDPRLGADLAGRNPLDTMTTIRNGVTVPLSRLYATYDWVRDDGYRNLPAWIEAAAFAAGRV